MISWTGLQTQFKLLGNTVDASHLAFGKTQINFGLHKVETALGSYVTERIRSDKSFSTGIQSYALPAGFVRLKQLYVTVGNVRYEATPVFDEATWQGINAYTQGSRSNFLEKVFVRYNTFEVWPIPSSANVYTIIFEGTSPDLSLEDYTTGSVTVTNGSSTFTGSLTTFTAAMVGEFVQTTNDQQWYEIGTYTSATSIAIKDTFQGATASGQSYTIGQMPRIPESMHMVPVYWALGLYYTGVKKDSHFGPLYMNMYKDELQQGVATFGRRYSAQVIPSQRNIRRQSGLINPNYYPQNVT